MAKEQWHNWGRYILLAIVIIFGSGGWIVTVRSNTEDIGILQIDAKVLKEDVHKLELADKDVVNIAKNTQNILVQVNSKLDAIQIKQTEQATIQAVNSEKLKTLTKD